MKKNKFIWIVLFVILIATLIIILLKFTNGSQTSTNEQSIKKNTVFEKKQIALEKNNSQNFIVKNKSKSNINNFEINSSKNVMLKNRNENNISKIQKSNKSKIKIILNSKTKVILDNELQTYKQIDNIYLKGNFTKQEIEKIKRKLTNKKGLFLVEKGENEIIVTLIKPIKITSNKISLNELHKVTFLKINKDNNVYYFDKTISKEDYKKIMKPLSKIKHSKIIIIKSGNILYVQIEPINPLTRDIVDNSLIQNINKFSMCETKLIIHFNFNSYDINKSNEIKLNNLKKEIQVFMPTQIIITGHTDNIGSKIYNQKLSIKRAKSVEKFLDFNNSKIKGYGEEKPIVPNDTPKNRALNRRAEIILCY